MSPPRPTNQQLFGTVPFRTKIGCTAFIIAGVESQLPFGSVPFRHIEGILTVPEAGDSDCLNCLSAQCLFGTRSRRRSSSTSSPSRSQLPFGSVPFRHGLGTVKFFRSGVLNLNCLSAQCLFGTPVPPQGRVHGGHISIAFRLSAFSALDSEGRTIVVPIYKYLNCLSAQCLFGTRRRTVRADKRELRISIAFRLSAFSARSAGGFASITEAKDLNCLSAQCLFGTQPVSAQGRFLR